MSIDRPIPFALRDPLIPYQPTTFLFDPCAARFFLPSTTARLGTHARAVRATLSRKSLKREAKRHGGGTR